MSFPAFEGEGLEQALRLARQSVTYREETGRDGTQHHAAYDAGSARTLRDLFDLVKDRPGTEVRVDGKRLPYTHELWLPLFWMFVGGQG